MKTKFFPYQAQCFGNGGFENLMNSTFDVIKSQGESVTKVDFWSKDADFDIAHFWGLGMPNFDNIIWAKKSNKKVVVTCILPAYATMYEVIRFYISNLLGRQKMIKYIFSLIDVIVVTSERSKIVAIKYYKVPTEKIKIIPNTLLSSYYKNKDNIYLNSFKLERYVFTIGNVCERKNQVRLALACLKINVNLLIVGPVLIGEESYGYELDELVRKSDNIIWIRSMERDSLELISAYRNSLLFALPSFNEQQPTSAQEAGLLGKPLILSNLPYANQKFYKNACLVDPKSISSIAKGIEAVIKNPNNYIPPNEIYSECREENVAKAYINIYNKL